MSIDQPRDHRLAMEVEHPSVRPRVKAYLLIGADRDNPIVADRNRLGDGEAVVDCNEFAASQHQARDVSFEAGDSFVWP
jgi:hypothetical protein